QVSATEFRIEPRRFVRGRPKLRRGEIEAISERLLEDRPQSAGMKHWDALWHFEVFRPIDLNLDAGRAWLDGEIQQARVERHLNVSVTEQIEVRPADAKCNLPAPVGLAWNDRRCLRDVCLKTLHSVVPSWSGAERSAKERPARA